MQFVLPRGGGGGVLSIVRRGGEPGKLSIFLFSLVELIHEV